MKLTHSLFTLGLLMIAQIAFADSGTGADQIQDDAFTQSQVVSVNADQSQTIFSPNYNGSDIAYSSSADGVCKYLGFTHAIAHSKEKLQDTFGRFTAAKLDKRGNLTGMEGAHWRVLKTVSEAMFGEGFDWYTLSVYHSITCE